MAKTCMINRNLKREKMATNQAKRRAEWKKMAIDETLSEEDRFAARTKLQKLPRNGAANRVRSICSLTGRARGVYRKFGLSRIKFRELSHQGKIPGVTKSSW